MDGTRNVLRRGRVSVISHVPLRAGTEATGTGPETVKVD